MSTFWVGEKEKEFSRPDFLQSIKWGLIKEASKAIKRSISRLRLVKIVNYSITAHAMKMTQTTITSN